jgi:hypothetical protein
MTFASALAVGAVLLAGWLDVRFDSRRPESLLRRVFHLAVAIALLQVASVGLPFLLGAEPGDIRHLAVVFVVLLPSMVYAFVTGLWMMRTLVEAAGLAR